MKGLESPKRRGVNSSTLTILRVLSQFSSKNATYGVTELSVALGINKNMCFRALRSLVDEGYVIKHPASSKYGIGYRVFALNGDLFEPNDLRSTCKIYMAKLHHEIGESVFLNVLAGKYQISVDVIEAPGRPIRRLPWGVAVPLHAGPGSRAILAALTDAEIDEYILTSSPLKRFTNNTITDPQKLKKELTLVRKRGYALNYNDHIMTDGNYISFAVLDGDGRPHGSITVAGPPDRFDERQMKEKLPLIRRIIDELNEQTALIPANPIFVSDR